MRTEKDVYIYPNDIGIRELDKVHGAPRFAFRPNLRGQAVYVMLKCKEEGIKTIYEYDEVKIYSKRKYERFHKICFDSFFAYTEVRKPLDIPTKAYYCGRHLVCVYVRDEDAIFLKESSMEEMVNYQFQGRIPITQNYFIYRTQEEMANELLWKGILL